LEKYLLGQVMTVLRAILDGISSQVREHTTLRSRKMGPRQVFKRTISLW